MTPTPNRAAPGATATRDALPTPAAPTMQAVVQRGYGTTDVLHLERVARPEPAEGQVLVRVQAAGLDRGVWHLMAGLPYVVRPMFGMSTPKQPIPGLDVAGTVEAVGAGVDTLAVGDRVFGTAPGAFAEYAVTDAARLARIPEGVDTEAAASLAVSGVTALEAVRVRAGVRAGHRVLVLGASGGVGGYAVQIAAAAGAEVTGVASAAKAELVRSWGATRVIDYATTDVTTLPERYDAIIDINGRLPLGRLSRLLTPRGRLVIVGGEGGNRLTGGIERQFAARLRSAFTRRTLGFFISSDSGQWLPELAELVASGAVRPTAGDVYPLADVRRTIDDLVAGRVRGKAVLHVTE
ncbi:MAG: NAD(P)-dependent alcohol dehydrogenase [Actinomycetales bacterium]|nr:NAD(P)-dependent alcohol dehydrogenase [Actinomycetales bacterium]